MKLGLLDSEMIYHCFHGSIYGNGGIETYVKTLALSSLPGISDRIITSIENLDQKQLKLLHIHSPEILVEWRQECPAIFTLHNHSCYCPSGTKYLADRQQICDRVMQPLGCTWGHVVDGCGSRRPNKIVESWRNSASALENLKKLPIPIIANSDYVRKQIIHNGLPAHRVTTLRCGVKPPQSPTAPLSREIHQNQRILFAGRIVPDKGVEWLIKALGQTDSRIHLDIAGDGWDKPAMERLAQKMGLSDRITWHGWCNSQQLETLYHQSFAVIFPSLWPEPAGLVTLEAYARYRPVIASAVGGIPEHIQDGKTGILVSLNNVSQLAAAIAQLATNYSQARFMGESGQAWYQQEFTIDVHVQRLAEIYAKTIAEFPARNKADFSRYVEKNTLNLTP